MTGAFLALRAKNRAFRSNSSDALRTSCGISAAIPCAPRGRAPAWYALRILFFAAVCLLLDACAPEVDLPAQYALVYGVDYSGTAVRALNHPDEDAAALSDLLRRKDYTVLAPSPLTRKADMIHDVDSLIAAGIERDSLFLFYFSGHGDTGTHINEEFNASLKAGSEYIAFRPASASKSAVADAAVSDDELMQIISRVPSRQKVVIIDACNSGGFIGDSPGVDTGNSPPVSFAGEAFSTYFANTESGDIAYTEAIVITAAGALESSYEQTGYYNHGVFTYFLLQTPGRADSNKDGYVTATEAYYFTKNAVLSVWNPSAAQFDGAPFYPHISGGAMDFVLFETD